MGRDEHSSPLMKMETTLTTPRRHTRRYRVLTWRTVMAPGSSKVLPSVECPITSSAWARADEIQFQICQIENRFLQIGNRGNFTPKSRRISNKRDIVFHADIQNPKKQNCTNWRNNGFHVDDQNQKTTHFAMNSLQNLLTNLYSNWTTKPP